MKIKIKKVAIFLILFNSFECKYNNIVFLNMKGIKYINSIIWLLILFSCTEVRKKDVDVSVVQVEISLNRLDKDMFEQKDSDIPKNNMAYFKKYGVFYERYLQDLLNLKDVNDPMLETNVRLFVNNSDMREVYKEIDKKYSDLAWLKDDFSIAFKHYKYYFPDSLIPEVAVFMSGLNYPNAASDSVLGIGLDMYLGSEVPFYKLIGLPQYKTQLMRGEYIVPDAVKAWLISESEYDPNNQDMLSQLIFQGKILYMTDALLPEVEDSLKIGYTADQLAWCKNNEGSIWAHVIDNKLLFSNNAKDISKLINDGPFTPGLPRESPGRVGVWLGWQIVNSYMQKQDKIDLVALSKLSPQEILQESKYKPKI